MALNEPTRKLPPRWFLVAGAVLLLALIGAHAVDAQLVNICDRSGSGIDGRDTHRLLRVLGSIYTWLIIGAAYMMHDWAARNEPERFLSQRDGLGALARGVFVLASAALSGAGAELVKLLVRRGRPDALWLASGRTLDQGDPATSAYTFFWHDVKLSSFFQTSELGMASSHASTAFGGAFALSILHPRGAPFFLALATLCANTRLQVRDHYLSDVIGGALVGLIVVWALVRLSRGR